MKEIISKTILLRKYNIDDAESIFKWRNDKSTTIYMGNKFRNPATIEQVRSSLQNVLDSDSKESLYYVIANKETKEYIGGIDLTSIDPIDKTCILSIVIGSEKNRKNGFVIEGIKRENRIINGKYKNLIQMGILETDYRNISANC